MSERRSWVTEYRTRGTPLRRCVNGALMVLAVGLILCSAYLTLRVAGFIWLLFQI